ncbi:hypothetical protein [Luteimonas lutimaris]|uniref:PKD domain-containing protein n=1 Tax=Luteimonas lutimaris TaxID=698645 RepID=A0ABP7M1Q8_9GAMM|nr:hypothetical protein [Luteimonas sp.]
MTSKTLNLAIAAALFGSLALVGCKKNQDEAAITPPPATTEPAPTTTPEPAPAPAAEATVTSVDLGNAVGADMKIDAPSTTFAPTDTIYASVATATSDPAATVPSKLTAKWSFEDGQVVNEESRDVNLSGDGSTEFHIEKPDGFPAGQYKVEISLDGNVVQSKDFTVE